MPEFSLNEINSTKSLDNQTNKEINKKKLIMIIGGIVLVLITIITIIVILNSREKTNDSPSNYEIKAEIDCIYEINKLDDIKILGDEFIKKTNFDIYIDGTKIKYTKQYTFDSIGIHSVKYLIYDDLYMDYMFKDIGSIININMTSTSNSKIISLISAFENCYNLKEIIIRGFATK